MACREPPFILFEDVPFFLECDLVDTMGKTGQLELSLFVGLDAVAAARVDVPEQDLDIGHGFLLRIDDLPKKIVFTELAIDGIEMQQNK
jgi:hypothetical protein